MLVPFFGGGVDAIGKNLPGFVVAGFASQELAVHEVCGDVVGVAFD